MVKSLLLRNFIKAIASHDFPGLRGLLDSFNYYDKQRVKELGPDRVAAEWIVRCEGRVKFDSVSSEIADYNVLIQTAADLVESGKSDTFHLVRIDATDSSITGYGCLHFEGLKHLTDVKFVRCKNLTDVGLHFLNEYVGKNLLTLRLESCPKISEDGLNQITNFDKLKYLSLHDLPYVKHKRELYQLLKKSLPSCDVHYPEAEKSAS